MIALFLISLLWWVRIVQNCFSYAALWRVKEYRFDRMLIHLKTHQGRRFWWMPWKRPPLSPKTLLLSLTTIAILLVLFFWLPFPPFIKLLIVDLVSFPLTFVLVALLNLPTRIYHMIIISLATRKLRRHGPMMVVGITGSYGKTSTKEYLATILSRQFSVLKTRDSKNSPIGIAEVILGDLKKEHEIFVVEMGAYKRGEIAEMARLVRPQIGIITAINAQHQDLFGTIENTMKAKYELIEGLTGKKLGIFNADDERVREMASWAKRDGVEVRYWSKKDAKNIRADFDGIEFTLKSNHVMAPVLGEHQVGNIMAALTGAEACDMNLKDAAKNASFIKPAKGVMEKISGVNGATFINDTFNNNPDAAKAAIAFLSKAKGRKILVFQPMIELGQYAASSHREVGKIAREICDEIILTNKSFYEEFPTARVMSADSAAKYLHGNVKKNDTVLFKGKEAGLVLKNL